jgi:hypothetical protein
MSLIGASTAAVAVVNFLILWFGIYFLGKWIPPSDDIPVWKAGVMAAVITVFAMLLVGFVMGVIV